MRKNGLMLFPLLLVAYEMAVYLSTDMYLPALPAIQRELQLDMSHVQFTLTAWFAGSACLQWLVGPLSDRFGRRPILLIGGIGFLLSCLVCATTHDLPTLLIARFIQGSAVCSVIVAGYAAVHECFSGKEAIKILALMSFITVTAPAAGPVLGAGLLWLGSWRLMFKVLAVVAALTLCGLYFYMPETLKKAHAIQIKPITLRYWQIAKKPSFILPVLANCCTFGMLIAWLTFGPFLIIHHYKISPQLYALTQVLVFGGYMLGNRMIPRLIEHHSMTRIVTMGLAIAIAACLATIVMTQCLLVHAALFPWWLLLGIATTTFGAGFCGPNLQRMAMEASEHPMGVKMALYSTGISLTGASISALVAHLNTHIWSGILVVMLSLLVTAMLLHLTHLKAAPIATNMEQAS